MRCDGVIAKTQSRSLPPERGKVRMGVGLTRSQAPLLLPDSGWGRANIIPIKLNSFGKLFWVSVFPVPW